MQIFSWLRNMFVFIVVYPVLCFLPFLVFGLFVLPVVVLCWVFGIKLKEESPFMTFNKMIDSWWHKAEGVCNSMLIED